MPRFKPHRLLALAVVACACSSDRTNDDPPAGTGGAGGIPANGGSPGSGGVPAAGGAPPAGGAPAAGGGPSSTGGVSTTGGAPNSDTGGAAGISTGGQPGSSDGGDPGEGGAPVSDEGTLVPHASWTCGMPDGIPPPARGKLVFKASLTLGDVHDVGATQYGKRRVLDVKGGTITGDAVRGTVQAGGVELELTLPNGAVELEQILMLRTSDGRNIYYRGCGTAAAGGQVRLVPDIEAPNAGAYGFLNTGKFAGTRVLDVAKKTLELALYDVASVGRVEPAVSVVEPAGLPEQSWECIEVTGQRGAVVYTESVGIGSSLSVGASKRGNRNVIPITGGTTSGRVPGKVLPGGADFQILGSPFVIDARYTIRTNDGEFVIVRNCGAVGALVPVFEARADGPYAFLNPNTWLSSDPSISVGAVNLTIYEKR